MGAAVHKLVDDAREIENLHADTFTQGPHKARENDGTYEFCVSTGSEVTANAEETKIRKENKSFTATAELENLGKAESKSAGDKEQQKEVNKSLKVETPKLGK